MEASSLTKHFDEETLAGENDAYAKAVEDLHGAFDFDFTALGLTPFTGAPLRWIYSAGATSNRFRRISLAPGHGIGGIVLKAGKPMLFTDIDAEMDPREYSSYPIVFAEDLRSFCALPVTKSGRVVGVLLMAFRDSSEKNAAAFRGSVAFLGGEFCDLGVLSEDFLNFEELADELRDSQAVTFLNRSSLSKAIEAQEQERKRISRELHDGIAQEMLTVSFQLRQVTEIANNIQIQTLVEEATNNLNRIMDELHNLSVDLRPSTLDHFGLQAALRSQAQVLEKTFGAHVVFHGPSVDRFDRAFEAQIYRICQEAILNACKYSGSDVIDVLFETSDGWLQAVVRDHGCGFDVEHPVVRGSGCGLPGMQERASMIGATLTFESGPEGTTMQLVAPMYGAPEEEGAS